MCMDLAFVHRIYKYLGIISLIYTAIVVNGVIDYGRCGHILQNGQFLANSFSRSYSHDVFPKDSNVLSRIRRNSQEYANGPGKNDENRSMCKIDRDSSALLQSHKSRLSHPFIAFVKPTRCCTKDFPTEGTTIPRSNEDGRRPLHADLWTSHTRTPIILNAVKDANAPKVPTRKRPYRVTDIDIGHVTQLRAYKVINIKSFFETQFEDNAVAEQKYSDYTATVSKMFFNELLSSGYRNLLSLFYHKWKTMDHISLSRGYRILFLEHDKNREYQKLLKTFVDIFHDPFLADLYVYQIAIDALRRTYIDGWILSLISLSSLKYFGTEFLHRTLVFPNFKEHLEDMENLDPDFTDALGYEVTISEMEKRRTLRKIYDSVLISCFESRHFKFFMSVYYDKLSTLSLMDAPVDRGYKCSFDSKFISLDSQPNKNGGQTFDDLLAKAFSGLKKLNLVHDAELIKKDMDEIPKGKLTKVSDNSWMTLLMLKHLLHNLFLSLDIPIPGSNGVGGINNSVDRGLNGLIDELLNLTEVSSSLKEYHSILSNKVFFRQRMTNDVCSVEDFMTYINDDAPAIPADNVEKICKFLRAPLHFTFLKKPKDESKKKDSLSNAIHNIRESVKSKSLDVCDIYTFMRALLNENISGSAAVSMLFILIPNLTFLKWTHFHLFVCAFEHDMEKNDVNSLNEVLGWMTKMDCKPEPAMYARFFNLCNITKQKNLIWDHFANFLRQDYKVYPETFAKYGAGQVRRVSIDMYNSVFTAALSCGKYRQGLVAFKRLLEDLEGMYRLIPFNSWNLIKSILRKSDVDSKLTSMVDQCAQLSADASLGFALLADIPKKKSVLAAEIISMLDEHLKKL